MRIQILPLTPLTVDGYTSTPFVLVIDEVDPEGLTADMAVTLKEQVGATAVWVGHTQALDVAPSLAVDDETRRSIEHAIAASRHSPEPLG